jgi:hypothetical protein
MGNIAARSLWLGVFGFVLLLSAPAKAQTIANGPYYATPSWDQTLACATTATCPRFIVLSNFSSQDPQDQLTGRNQNPAVLDRETGLVWERSPATTTHSWGLARFECTSRTTGGRKGWRLPSVHELASLADPNNVDPNFVVPALPPGHPFQNVQSAGYWSATADAGAPTFAWNVGFRGGGVGSDGKGGAGHVWCVRGGHNDVSEY